MIKLEGRRIIRAPVQKVFQLVGRLDTASRVTGLWLTVDLLERKSNSLTVHYKGYFAGMPVESVQRATLYPPGRVEFRQTRGGLKVFRGQYQLKPIEEDTELSLSLEADVGIPLISDEAARRVLSAFIERSLEKFKLTAERELPRVTRRAAENGERRAADVEAVAPPAPPEGPVPETTAPMTPAPPPPVAPTPQAGTRKRRRRRRRRRGGAAPRPGGQA